MVESVLIHCESGLDMVHDLPLPDGLSARVAAGEAAILGPCDADGNLTVAVEPEAGSGSPDAGEGGGEPDPAPAPVVKQIRKTSKE